MSEAPNWMLDGRAGHVVVMRGQDPDCFDGDPWGDVRCQAAVKAFNAALGLEHPQYVLTYENGMVQAHVGCGSDDALEAELSRCHQLGMVLGYEGGADMVREAGVTLWKQGRDTEARFLRNLADRIMVKSEAARPPQGKP